jgi:hypothetical protein
MGSDFVRDGRFESNHSYAISSAAVCKESILATTSERSLSHSALRRCSLLSRMQAIASDSQSQSTPPWILRLFKRTMSLILSMLHGPGGRSAPLHSARYFSI